MQGGIYVIETAMMYRNGKATTLGCDAMISCVQRLYRSVVRLAGDRSGNLAVMFALALIPAAGAVGVAVDYSKASQLRTRMQDVLDAAVLAGLKESSSTLQISKASSYFQSQTSNNWGAAPLRRVSQSTSAAS